MRCVCLVQDGRTPLDVAPGLRSFAKMDLRSELCRGHDNTIRALLAIGKDVNEKYEVSLSK